MTNPIPDLLNTLDAEMQKQIAALNGLGEQDKKIQHAFIDGLDRARAIFEQHTETIEQLSEEIKELKEKIYYYELPGKLIEQQQAD